MTKWTIKQLKEISDVDFIQALLRERQQKLHPYSPLNGRIQRALDWLNSKA